MKTFINTLSNTYKLFRVLSNPETSTYLEKQLNQKNQHDAKRENEEETTKFGKNSAYFHKHYIVHVIH